MLITVDELIAILDVLKVPKHKRIGWLQIKTGYSRTLVGDVLAGRRVLTDRFARLALDSLEKSLQSRAHVPTEGVIQARNKVARMKANIGEQFGQDVQEQNSAEVTELLSSGELDKYLHERFGDEVLIEIKKSAIAMLDSLTFLEIQDVIRFISDLIKNRRNTIV